MRRPVPVNNFLEALRQTIGEVAWGSALGVGSSCTIEFGIALRVVGASHKRFHGARHLWVYCSAWRIEEAKTICSEDRRRKSAVSIPRLDTHKVTDIALGRDHRGRGSTPPTSAMTTCGAPCSTPTSGLQWISRGFAFEFGRQPDAVPLQGQLAGRRLRDPGAGHPLLMASPSSSSSARSLPRRTWTRTPRMTGW